MQEAYSNFAEVYDLFMDNVPYKDWAKNIKNLLVREKIFDGLVLDLGCGTGVLTRILSDMGYDMIGVDFSEEMLNIAKAKTDENSQILYLCQDMREFELYGTVKAVISICDSMNYILDEEDFVKVLTLVNNYLDPGGVFIFDLNTIYKYETLLGETTIAENREEGSFIWENYFDSETKINEYDLTLFIKNKDHLFQKFEEAHYQRAYYIEEIESMIQKSGMEFVRKMDADTCGEVHDTTERIYFVVRESGKEKA